MFRLSVLATIPKESLNWRLYLAIFSIGILGAARGLDEGIISSQTKQTAFISTYGVKYGSSTQANITSMVQLSSIAGSLLAWYTSDKLGRVRASQIACLFWILGTVVWMASPYASDKVGTLYAGRFLCGLGVGGTVVAAPAYLSEISPKSIRGAIVGIFSGSVYLGILLGYCANLGVKRNLPTHSLGQCLIPTSLNLMFALLTLVTSLFIKESPRWLMKQGREQDAIESMRWFRQLREEHPYVRQEIDGIRETVREEEVANAGRKWYDVCRDMFTRKENLYPLVLVCGCQVWGQFSGGGSVTIYAPELFEIVSGKGTDSSLFTTAIFGVVKFVAALLSGLVILDLFGRKCAAFIGITLQTIASLYIAAFLTKYDPDVIGTVASSAAEKRASEAAIAMIFISGVGWVTGFNSIQYLLGAEMFPIPLRAAGQGISMIVHFLCQYGSSRSVTPMIAALGANGTFFFWGAESLCCLFLVWFFIPETAGRNLESIQELFAKPWYKIGMSANRPVRGKAFNEFEPEEMGYSGAPHPVLGQDLEAAEKKESDNTKTETK